MPTVIARLEHRPRWQIAFWIAITMRVIYLVLGAIASQVLHPAASRIATNFTGELTPYRGIAHALIGVWQRFDTLFYVRIALHGYSSPALTVFFPLYPACIRLLMPVFGPMFSALLISSVAAFFAFWGFLRLAMLDLPEAAAIRGLLLYAVWPASFILFAGYTESLTLALVIWSVYFARTDKWWASGICGCFAGLARSAGALVIIPLLCFAWQQRKYRPWPILLASAGAVAYPLWLRWSGRPSLVEVYRRDWHIGVAAPWITLAEVARTLFSGINPVFLLNVLLLVSISIMAARARPWPAYPAFSAAIILQALLRYERPLLLGFPRYLLLVFPAFVAMGKLVQNSPRLQRLFPAFCGLLLICNLGFMWAFLNWSLQL